jgi:hypothetical protein
MANPRDPVGAGLVASLARPGGNVTGLSSLTTELNTKRLEILRDAVPKLTRVGFLPPQDAVSRDLQLKELRPAALELKLKLEEIETQLDAQRFRERLSNRKAKASGCDHDGLRSPLFRRKKAHRRACRQTQVSRRSSLMRAVSCPMGQTLMTSMFTWTRS